MALAANIHWQHRVRVLAPREALLGHGFFAAAAPGTPPRSRGAHGVVRGTALGLLAGTSTWRSRHRRNASTNAWRKVDEDASGVKDAFEMVCLIDPKVLVNDWEEFEAFATDMLSGADAQLVADENSPPFLLRSVEKGEHQWPIMQEGRT